MRMVTALTMLASYWLMNCWLFRYQNTQNQIVGNVSSDLQSDFQHHRNLYATTFARETINLHGNGARVARFQMTDKLSFILFQKTHSQIVRNINPDLRSNFP